MKRLKLRYNETSVPLDEVKQRWSNMYEISTADFSNGMDALNLTRLQEDAVRNAEIRRKIYDLFDNEIASGNLIASIGTDGIRCISGLELTRFADSRGVEIIQDKRTGGRPSHAEGWYDQLENIEKLAALQKERSRQEPPASAVSSGKEEPSTDRRSDSSPFASDTTLPPQSEEQLKSLAPEVQAARTYQTVNATALTESKPQKPVEGITKNQILTAFDALVMTTNLSKAMADGAKWAVRARVSKGTRGRGGHQSLWNPLLMAVALCERKLATKAALNRAFLSHHFLAEWRERWHEHSESI